MDTVGTSLRPAFVLDRAHFLFFKYDRFRRTYLALYRAYPAIFLARFPHRNDRGISSLYPQVRPLFRIFRARFLGRAGVGQIRLSYDIQIPIFARCTSCPRRRFPRRIQPEFRTIPHLDTVGRRARLRRWDDHGCRSMDF